MASELRIGDVERERASSTLAEHFAQGRLDNDEYAERLDAVWTARTRSDLDQLFWDLPATPPAPPAVTTRSGRRGPRRRTPLLVLALGLVLLAIVAHLPLWLLVVLLFVGVHKLRGGCRG